ncbi:penicillin-binding protein 2 [Streptosporangiaceae bacterium NEAU-GS5]|nr:penicillin-binding protein 2 [Streptosporangiaceae bacterium NEAU-GS5]
MAGPRVRRINIPLRGVALASGGMMFALLGNVTYIQGFRADALNADPRNQRTLIARFDNPRGDILLSDGTVVARSRHAGGQYAYRREYPYGRMYAPVTGYLALYGSTGIERAEEDYLSGSDPKVKVRSLIKGDPPSGATVTLTVDPRAQRAAYESLRATGQPGAVVAINPATGAILAMASYPTYDPNDYTTTDSARLARVDKSYRKDPGRPLLNRALNQTYPPGSTFKVVTSAAGLGSGDYQPSTDVSAPTQLRLPGTTTYLRNSGGEPCGDGTPTFALAFQLSCNTAFANVGLDLGQDVLRAQADAFGFDDDSLSVPMPVSPSIYPAGLDKAQTAMSAIGQFDVRATPLQIAMISAAIGNGGELMRPYLVDEVRLGDGSLVDTADPEEYRQAVSGDVAEQLTSMMVSVTEPGGTGAAAAIPGVEVAAKTGTAENEGSDHAVFTAFAPARSPVVAVGVLLEHGGFGGVAAAPIARAVIQSLL